MVDSLFQFMDKNNNSTISITELVKACSPDINNNNSFDDRELNIGKRNALVWIATILYLKPSILSDNLIDKREFRDLLSYPSQPMFYTGHYTPDGSLQLKPEFYSLFANAQSIIDSHF